MVGLNHLAFDVPDKRSFAEAYRKLVDGGVEVEPIDHRIGWGCYFKDPDGNGLEIYCDTRNATDGDNLWRGKDRPLTREHILAALRAG
jgi:catechol 2,3-dioxygenase